ncbi:MAG: hypothetical protein L6Q95_16765, partial [Planctomycetes bacterium]|nr:hypothetical protein [Planctomycetota bacterium]
SSSGERPWSDSFRRKRKRTVSAARITRSVPHDLLRDFLPFEAPKASLRRLRGLAPSQIDRERARRERAKPATHRTLVGATRARRMRARVARIELRVFLSK